jgi:cation transport regulator ChaB
VKKLPSKAQDIWIAAYNAAIKEYKGDEAKAFGTAWAAVKKKYTQQPDGSWALKKGRGMEQEHASLPMLTRAVAAFQPGTVDEEARTIEVTWTTGATVRRASFFGAGFDEELLMGDENVDLSRLNSGAPVLNSHNAYDLSKVLGVVEDGSARLLGPKGQRKGRATVRFSDRADVEPIWRDVRTGIIRNLSAGYSVEEWQRINTPPTAKGEDAIPLMRAVRWTPLELSLVAIPADAGAQVRAGGDVFPCIIRSAEEENTVTRAASGAAAEAAEDARPGEVQPPVPATQPAQYPPADPQPTQPPPPPPPAQPDEGGRAAQDGAARERSRILAIQENARRLRLTGPADVEFVSGLVSRGVTLEQALQDMTGYVSERWNAQADASPAARVTGGHSGSTRHRAEPAGSKLGPRPRAASTRSRRCTAASPTPCSTRGSAATGRCSATCRRCATSGRTTTPGSS